MDDSSWPIFVQASLESCSTEECNATENATENATDNATDNASDNATENATAAAQLWVFAWLNSGSTTVSQSDSPSSTQAAGHLTTASGEAA